jgi:hypothetical protein
VFIIQNLDVVILELNLKYVTFGSITQFKLLTSYA